MGNVLHTIIGSIIVLYLKINAKIKSLWNENSSSRSSSFHPNEILLKDDESEVGIQLYNFYIKV